jgi:hypothetical protein
MPTYPLYPSNIICSPSPSIRALWIFTIRPHIYGYYFDNIDIYAKIFSNNNKNKDIIVSNDPDTPAITNDK